MVMSSSDLEDASEGPRPWVPSELSSSYHLISYCSWQTGWYRRTGFVALTRNVSTLYLSWLSDSVLETSSSAIGTLPAALTAVNIGAASDFALRHASFCLARILALCTNNKLQSVTFSTWRNVPGPEV